MIDRHDRNRMIIRNILLGDEIRKLQIRQIQEVQSIMAANSLHVSIERFGIEALFESELMKIDKRKSCYHLMIILARS